MSIKKIVKKVVAKKPVAKKVKVVKQKPKPLSQLPPLLLKYLDQARLKHEIIEHRTVYTAIDAAATMRRKVDEIVKSLLVKADKDYYLVLVPGDHNINLEKLTTALSKFHKKEIKMVKIPGEKIMADLSNFKAGTLSAFGKLHNLQMVVEKKLEKTKKGIFATGSYNHSIEMAVKDFIKHEAPIIASFGDKKKIKIVKPVVKKVKKVASKAKKVIKKIVVKKK